MDRIIEVKINGNFLTKDNKNAGVQHEGNVTNLRIEFDPGWDSYAKKVTWWDAKGENPVERTLTADLLEDIQTSTRVYIVPIPAEPLAEAGECTFVIDGYIDGKRLRSVADTLRVKAAPFISNAEQPVDPTPTQAEQLQAQIDTLLSDISEDMIAAQDAADAALLSETKAKASEENAAASEAAAAASASDAEENAQKAAESAETAKEYSGNAPIIRNGTWWTWNAQTQQYVDTGNPAQGEKGDAGQSSIDLNSGEIVKFWFGTVDEYNALTTYDTDVYYNILEGEACL